MKRELYISGKLIELSDSEPIAISYQVNDIAELTDRQANYSNTFTVPPTENNHKHLNFSNIASSAANDPYRRLPCTYIENGIYKIPSGIAVIEESSNGYQITVYSGIIDFFDQIEGQNLKGINWSAYNHDYTVGVINLINGRYINGTSDVCWPLIQWGAYKLNQNVDIKYQQPAIRFSTVFEKIFEQTNYTFSGQIFDEGVYQDMALTLSPDEYEISEEDLEDISYIAKLSTQIDDNTLPSQNGPSIANIIPYFRDFIDGNNPLESIYDSVNPWIIPWPVSWMPPQTLSNSRYRSKSFVTLKITVKLFFQQIELLGNENVRIFKNNILLRQTQVGDYPGTSGYAYNLQFEDVFTIDLKPGDEIKIQLYGRHLTVNNTDPAKNHLSMEAISTIPLGGTLDYNFLVPDYSLKEIVKSFCQMFGLIITPSPFSNEMVFTKFREIKENIEDADDWSRKIDPSEPPVLSFRIGEYAQLNSFRYASDEYTKEFGDAAFAINDQVLKTKYDAVQLLWPSCLSEENIRTTGRRLLPLPLPDYASLPTFQYLTAYTAGTEVGYNNVIYRAIINVPGGIAIDPYHTGYWQIRTDQYITTATNQGVKIDRYTLIEADPWDQVESYSQFDEVNYGGQIWVSQINDNLNNIPQTGPGNWELRTLQYEQTINAASRIVLIRPINYAPKGSEPFFDYSINYTDGTTISASGTTGYPMAYFADNLEPYNLTWQYLLENYYKELQEMLVNLKSITCLMRLTDADIANLDFLKLKYVKLFGNYFYLNLVEDYISGQSAKVQLIRM